MKRAIVSVTNDLATDQRVIKTTKLLCQLGFEVLLIGRKRPNSLDFNPQNIKTKRFRLLFNKKFAFYAEYNLRLFFYLVFKKCSLYIANDLDTLLPNYLLSKIKNKPLIYDSHEYFTGVPEIQNRLIVKKTWKLIEKTIFPKLKDVITVNDSIAGLYEKEYGIRPIVVRNLPESQPGFVLKSRKELNLPEDKNIILMQGSGINVDRGAEELLLSMKPQYGLEGIALYYIGSGDVISLLKSMVKDYGLEDRVHFIPKVNYNTLKHYTANANIGVTIDKGDSLNYLYSLPNKLFDYINAGLPVLASKMPEVEKIVKKHNIGLTIDNHEPAHIASKIKEMLSDQKLYQQLKGNTRKAADKLIWEKESVVLKEIFKKYI